MNRKGRAAVLESPDDRARGHLVACHQKTTYSRGLDTSVSRALRAEQTWDLGSPVPGSWGISIVTALSTIGTMPKNGVRTLSAPPRRIQQSFLRVAS